MPLQRTPEGGAVGGDLGEPAPEFCDICKETLTTTQLNCTTPCGHRFHDSCMQEFLKTSRICIICKNEFNPAMITFEENTLAAELPDNMNLAPAQQNFEFLSPEQRPSGRGRGRGAKSRQNRTDFDRRKMRTRSQTRNGRDNSVASTAPYSQEGDESENTSNVIHAIIKSQQKDMMTELSSFVKRTIEESLRAQLGRLTLGTDLTPTQPQQPDPQSEVQRNQPSQRNAEGVRNQFSSASNRSVAPEKAANILASWRLKFDGSKDSMYVDEFLYRLRSLTSSTLNNDYGLLCDNLHLLFSAKASDWFWNFHRKNPLFSWQTFSVAFRQRFDDTKDDFDLWELIRRRRQREGESFDDFQSAMEDLVSRLSSEVAEDKIVDILKRNAKVSLRYELLHLKIKNRCELREEVKKHDNFCIETNNAIPRNRFGKQHVSEILTDTEEEEESVAQIDSKKGLDKSDLL